jgi:quinohemoprotein ethanol dehydrogenase
VVRYAAGMENRIIRAGAIALGSVAWLLGAAAPSAPQVGADWPHYGGIDENHFSPLAQIDTDNVGKLGLAWHHDIATGPSSLSAPVAVGGVLYFVAGQAVVHALDATSGKLLWTYDPEVWKRAGERMRAAWGTRGLAYDNGRIFVGTVDGRLIALDAHGGKPLWSVVTVEKDDGRYITGAPWVFDGKVAIGHGGADFAPVRGYVTTYDQKSGKQLWRFHTVPGDPKKGFESKAMAMAAKTWTGEWWKFGGGGTVWNAMAYDPKFHRLYIGTGNGAPWNQKIRSPGGGDNLFLCSIIALDADTGEYIWHYQVNPGESWDYNAAMDIELADLKIGGRVRPVILHAPKNGFFYVIDRETGKPISAEKFMPANWASRIDIATGRPVENPEARYPDGKPALVTPSGSGAHSIEVMSYNPGTGLAYIPALDKAGVYADPPGALKDWRFAPDEQLNPGTGPAPAGFRLPPPSSALLAWNPVTQKPVWRIDLPGARSFGGTATTAGNLLMAGDVTGRFAIYDARSGKRLWSFDAQTAVTAQPITYSVRGRQYISVIAGARMFSQAGLPHKWDYRTQKWRMLTFALGGRDSLPRADVEPLAYQDDPAFAVDPARAARGAAIYGQRCTICHGANAMAAGAAPSLLTSAIPLDADAFRAVLHDGVLRENGMPGFEQLKPENLDDLRHFIRQRARAEMAAAKP